MDLAKEYPNLDTLLTELFESIGDIKNSLRDGRITPDEIVGAVPDPAVQAYLRTLLNALQGLPGEVQRVTDGGPWQMMSFVQAVVTKVSAVFK